MFTFALPDPGEGLLEAEITQWLVSEGDEVRVNDVLVEIETAKSLVELPSPVSGTIARLLVAVGETVEVGAPIIEIDDGSDTVADATLAEARAASPTTMAEVIGASHLNPVLGFGDDEQARHRSQPASGCDPGEPRSHTDDAPKNLVGSGPIAEPTGRRSPAPEPQPVTTAVGKVLAKPLVRRLARDLGVQLNKVRPTGPHGSVSRADVEAAAGLAQQAGTERVAIKGVRKATAQNVAASVAKHVHVTEFNTIDVTASMELIARLKTRREFKDLHVSPLLLHAKAVCLAMAHQPELNASWDAEAGQIVYHDDVNLGIAAATPRGLLVPVIKGADKMNLLELCRAINELVATAKAGTLQPADYSGGTFSITNVGVFGIDTGTPIINGDESAILAMGAIKRKPWVVGSGDDERIEPRWVTTLALSFDHQLIDGEGGSRFLADVSTILEAPELAMLF